MLRISRDAFVLFVLVALTACGNATVSPAPPSSAALAEGLASVVQCVARAPEFEGEQLDAVTVHDATGRVLGCRHVGFQEREAMRRSLGPPMPHAMTDRTLEISRADRDGTRALMMWVVADCDADAEVSVVHDESGYAVSVAQRREGPCAPGTALTAVEVAFDGPVTEMTGTIQRLSQ